MRSSQTSHLGRVGEASAKAVVATDSVSADADCDNGKRRLPCRSMRRPDACRRGALVAREAREEAKSVEQSARPGRTSFFGSSRLGNGAALLHQAKLVLDGPRLGDLAFLYAVEGDAREFHLLAGRSDAHIFPLMSGAAPPASHHHVSFSYEVLNGAYHVREALPEICCLLLSSLGLPGCIEFLCCVEIPGMVPEFFLLPTYHGFVLFRRHLRLLLPSPLSTCGPQRTVHRVTRRCPVHPSHYALTERSARRRRRKLWPIIARWIVPVPLRAAALRRACPPPPSSPQSCPRPPDLWNGLQTRPACPSGLPPRTRPGACPETRTGWPPPPLRRSAQRWYQRSPGRHDVSRPRHA